MNLYKFVFFHVEKHLTNKTINFFQLEMGFAIKESTSYLKQLLSYRAKNVLQKSIIITQSSLLNFNRINQFVWILALKFFNFQFYIDFDTFI